MNTENGSSAARVEPVVSRWSWFAQRPTVGSRWYFGNFAIGLIVDSHPRFTNIVLCLGFIEIGISRKSVDLGIDGRRASVSGGKT